MKVESRSKAILATEPNDDDARISFGEPTTHPPTLSQSGGGFA